MLDAVMMSEAPMGPSKVTRTRPFSSTTAEVAVRKEGRQEKDARDEKEKEGEEEQEGEEEAGQGR